MLALAKLLEECGLPPGVLNVVTGSSSSAISKPIIGDPRLRKLSFTGSTEVGRKLIAQAADNVLKVSMELGGNAPFLVFDDADIDAAVEGAMIAKMRNIGEACTSANRFHVAEGVAGEFAEKLGERMGALKLGRGTEEGVDVGPLIDADQRDKVAELVDDAVEKGATCRGRRLGRRRQPATSSSRPCSPTSPTTPGCSREEIFGPVAPVKGFATDEEAVAAANDTEYGLVAYVYTSRPQARAARLRGLETGMIGLNQGMVSNAGAPFGGREAVGDRPRGRQRGHPRVPGDQVRGGQPVIADAGRARSPGRDASAASRSGRSARSRSRSRG